MKNVRKNLTMSPELAKWFEEKAKQLGVSQTAMMTVALGDYMKQEKAMNMMSNFEFVEQQLQELAGQQPEK